MFIRLEPQNSPAAPEIPTLIHHTQVLKDIAKAKAAKDLPLTLKRVAYLSPTLFSPPPNMDCPRQALAGWLSHTCPLPPTS